MEETPFTNACFYAWKSLGRPFAISSHATHYFGDESNSFRIADHEDAYGSSLINIVIGKSIDADFEISEDATEEQVKNIIEKALKQYMIKLEELEDEL